MNDDQVPPILARAVLSEARTIFKRCGQTLINSGSPSNDVFYIVEGNARIVLYSPDGKETIFREVGPNQFIGEFAAVDGQRRSADVVAISDLKLACVSAEKFVECLETVPGAGLWIARRLTTEIRHLTDRLMEIATYPVNVRVHCAILRLCANQSIKSDQFLLENAPSHAELASRVGTNREAVTRELRYLASKKLVSLVRRRLTVASHSGLVALVEKETGLPFWRISN